MYISGYIPNYFVVFFFVRVPYCIFKLAMIWYLIINTIFTLCPHTETIASYRDLYLKARAGHKCKATWVISRLLKF